MFCIDIIQNKFHFCILSYILPVVLPLWNLLGPVGDMYCFSNTYRMLVQSALKAILQVLIYKALYDKSYLGSKTTMTSGEWTCLISFATAPLTCSEQGGCEKFKMKIYVSSGIRTHTPPVHDRKVSSAPQTARPRGLDGDQWFNV